MVPFTDFIRVSLQQRGDGEQIIWRNWKIGLKIELIQAVKISREVWDYSLFIVDTFFFQFSQKGTLLKHVKNHSM